MTPFERAVEFVLAREGLYSYDPHDPGLETIYGISRRAHPNLAPWPPSRAEAIAIYKKEYWDEMRCSHMPPRVALMVFDAAVNQGAERACLMLQRAALVGADGIIGPVTLAAVSAHPDETLERLVAERCWTYAETRNYARYGRGWYARVAGALITAVKGGD